MTGEKNVSVRKANYLYLLVKRLIVIFSVVE